MAAVNNFQFSTRGNLEHAGDEGYIGLRLEDKRITYVCYF
jgi:hypothetical protein